MIDQVIDFVWNYEFGFWFLVGHIVYGILKKLRGYC